MQTNSLSLRRGRLVGLAWLLGACLSLPGFAQTAAAPVAAPAATAQTLDNATCLSCHDGKKGKLEVPGAEGKPRALHSVAPDKFGQSVHAKMQCVACHTDITDNAEKGNLHAKDTAQKLKKVDCASCHQSLWEQAQKDGTAKSKPGLGLVAENIEAYKKSFHARPNTDDKTKPNASCDNCHDTHSFKVPAKGTPEYAEHRLGISKACGENCHSDQLDAYAGSVHGKEVLDKKNAKAATCADCHSAHSVGNSSGRSVQALRDRAMRQLPRSPVQIVQIDLPRTDQYPGLRLHGQVLQLPWQPRDPEGQRSQIDGRAGKPHEDLPGMPQRQEGRRRGACRLRQLRAARARQRLCALPADLDRVADHGAAAGRHLCLLLAAHPAVVLSRIQGTQGQQGSAAHQAWMPCWRSTRASMSGGSARSGASPT